jgi:hypothetical protein
LLHGDVTAVPNPIQYLYRNLHSELNAVPNPIQYLYRNLHSELNAVQNPIQNLYRNLHSSKFFVRHAANFSRSLVLSEKHRVALPAEASRKICDLQPWFGKKL